MYIFSTVDKFGGKKIKFILLSTCKMLGMLYSWILNEFKNSLSFTAASH